MLRLRDRGVTTVETTRPDLHPVHEYVAHMPIADYLLEDIGADAALKLAEQDARDRLAAELGSHSVLSVAQRWVDLLPGHTLGGFDVETGEPVGPTGRIVLTSLRVVWR